MSSKGLFDFSNRGTWEGSLNNSDGKKAGVYTVVTNQSTTDFPEKLSLEYGTLLYFKATGGSGGNPEVQILVRTYPTTGLWIRGYWGGNAPGWTKIYKE